MANTYTWIGAPGTAASDAITADWTPAGHPRAGDTGILTDGGTILFGNGQLNSNTLVLGNGLLVFAGDTRDTIGGPPADSLTLITTTTGPSLAQSSMIDALGNFVNAGTILADGPKGSTVTINVRTTASYRSRRAGVTVRRFSQTG
jgi:hypothetical protein